LDDSHRITGVLNQHPHPSPIFFARGSYYESLQERDFRSRIAAPRAIPYLFLIVSQHLPSETCSRGTLPICDRACRLSPLDCSQTPTAGWRNSSKAIRPDYDSDRVRCSVPNCLFVVRPCFLLPMPSPRESKKDVALKGLRLVARTQKVIANGTRRDDLIVNRIIVSAEFFVPQKIG